MHVSVCKSVVNTSIAGDQATYLVNLLGMHTKFGIDKSFNVVLVVSSEHEQFLEDFTVVAYLSKEHGHHISILQP